jgi:hypothetical protein
VAESMAAKPLSFEEWERVLSAVVADALAAANSRQSNGVVFLAIL